MPGWQGQKMRLDAFKISPIFTIVVILLLRCYVLFIGSAVALPTRLQKRHFFAILRPAAGSMQFLLLQTNLQTLIFSVFRKTFATPDFFGQKIGTKKNLVRFIFGGDRYFWVHARFFSKTRLGSELGWGLLRRRQRRRRRRWASDPCRWFAVGPLSLCWHLKLERRLRSIYGDQITV